MVFVQLGDGPFLPVRDFSETSMTIDAPAAPAGATNVRISLNSGYDWSTGTQASVQTFEYYVARPSALEPTGGHVRGGTSVTVDGDGFLNTINTSLFRVRLGAAGDLVPTHLAEQTAVVRTAPFAPSLQVVANPKPKPNPNPTPTPTLPEAYPKPTLTLT